MKRKLRTHYFTVWRTNVVRLFYHSDRESEVIAICCSLLKSRLSYWMSSLLRSCMSYSLCFPHILYYLIWQTSSTREVSTSKRLTFQHEFLEHNLRILSRASLLVLLKPLFQFWLASSSWCLGDDFLLGNGETRELSVTVLGIVSPSKVFLIRKDNLLVEVCQVYYRHRRLFV